LVVSNLPPTFSHDPGQAEEAERAASPNSGGAPHLRHPITAHCTSLSCSLRNPPVILPIKQPAAAAALVNHGQPSTMVEAKDSPLHQNLSKAPEMTCLRFTAHENLFLLTGRELHS